jgi:hypothetical protein
MPNNQHFDQFLAAILIVLGDNDLVFDSATIIDFEPHTQCKLEEWFNGNFEKAKACLKPKSNVSDIAHSMGLSFMGMDYMGLASNGQNSDLDGFDLGGGHIVPEFYMDANTSKIVMMAD